MISVRPPLKGSLTLDLDTISDLLCNSGWVTVLLWTSNEGVRTPSPLQLWCSGTQEF